jgi:hypothetical protein
VLRGASMAIENKKRITQNTEKGVVKYVRDIFI